MYVYVYTRAHIHTCVSYVDLVNLAGFALLALPVNIYIYIKKNLMQ